MAHRPTRTIRDRISALRDRFLTDPRFLRLAAAFPPSRFIARRRAAALFDLCAGFVYSQILHACVTLGLFEILREGPEDGRALARRLGLGEEAATRLLSAAAALRLVERRGGDRFGLGPLGAAIVANPGVAAMVEHHARLYADLRNPVALLRGEAGDSALAAYWPYADCDNPAALPPEAVGPYSRLMALSQPLVAEEILASYPLHRHTCLLDVGGGEGAFLLEVASRAPSLQLILFDLPAVAARASERFAAAGVSSRATAFGGDFRSDQLPPGADLITLVRVLLDHDDDTVRRILAAVRRALPPEGVLLVAEPMSGLPGAESIEAYFTFYLMAMGRGRSRTPADLATLLRQSGFTDICFRSGARVLRTGLITARPEIHC